MNLGEMREFCRLIINDEAVILTDAEVDSYLKHGLRKTVRLIESLDETYFVEQDVLTLTAGEKTLQVPTEIRRAIRLYLKDNNGEYDFTFVDYKVLERAARTTENRYNFVTPVNPYVVALRGQRELVFGRAPTKNWTLYFDYTTKLTLPTGASQELQLPFESHDLVVHEAALMAIRAENGDELKLRNSRDEVASQLITSMENRQVASPRMVNHYAS